VISPPSGWDAGEADALGPAGPAADRTVPPALIPRQRHNAIILRIASFRSIGVPRMRIKRILGLGRRDVNSMEGWPFFPAHD
jgi:hypothetical protein